MNEEVTPQVEVKVDGATESLGDDAKNAVKSGDFKPPNEKLILFVTTGIALIIGVATFLTGKPQKTNYSGKAVPPPGVYRNDSGINPKFLTERDLINMIPRPKVDSSLMGKIKVVSLRTISSLPVGSEMKAVLVSGGTDGIVKAKLTAALIVDSEPLLPENSVLFGRGKSGDERLFVEFTKVIFPSGEAFAIKAQAFDASDKIQGLKGALVGTRTKKMAGAITFGFMGGMADGMQESSGSYFAAQKPSTRDAALAGASKAALDQSEAYLEEMKKSPNIIEVKSGTEILVITDEPKEKRKGFYEEN